MNIFGYLVEFGSQMELEIVGNLAMTTGKPIFSKPKASSIEFGIRNTWNSLCKGDQVM